MTPRVRTLALTAHVFFSVSWPGAVVAYLALAIAALISDDVQFVHAATASTLVIGWTILVPLSLLALITGIVQSLITRWGVFRHWWVVAKLGLTLIGTLILIQHMRAMSGMEATTHAMHDASYRGGQMQHLLHAGGGLLLLLAVTALSIYKPWGLTPIGQRKALAPPEPRTLAARHVGSVRPARSGVPRWAMIVGWHLAALILLAVVAHLAGLHGGHLD